MEHTAPLTLYNSLTRSLEPFAPLDPEKGVRVYSCGPTVYNYAHLGNLRAYVFTDTLGRVLRWKGARRWACKSVEVFGVFMAALPIFSLGQGSQVASKHLSRCGARNSSTFKFFPSVLRASAGPFDTDRTTA